MQKYAFVDRDGTFLSEPERPEGVDPRETFPLKSAEDVRFMEGALDGLRTLSDKGYKLVLVSNQSHLGTVKHPLSVFDAVMARMRAELEQHGIRFAFEMVCPHGPDDGCGCRKPNIGGVTQYVHVWGS
jgi:imidazoleglycerol-phosphate dehydratase / histidinol-phosphatase